MKRLHFSYTMQIEYSLPVQRCNFTIKCIPLNTARQRVDNFRISLLPDVEYCEGVDGLGNKQIYGLNEEEHRSFSFNIEGDVVTGLASYEEGEDDNLSAIFRHPYGLNKPGQSIQAFFNSLRLDDLSLRDKAMYILNALKYQLVYKTGSTNVGTTAEEAMAQRCGVCQDYAHIYISLLHLAGIPARYVTGLIIGEGASHAWVEILDDHIWYGIDPTNDCIVGDNYIKIGVGRDARDCMINRGIMHGGGPQLQTINVSVIEKKG